MLGDVETVGTGEGVGSGFVDFLTSAGDGEGIRAGEGEIMVLKKGKSLLARAPMLPILNQTKIQTIIRTPKITSLIFIFLSQSYHSRKYLPNHQNQGLF
jgi:hypothetical protein